MSEITTTVLMLCSCERPPPRNRDLLSYQLKLEEDVGDRLLLGDDGNIEVLFVDLGRSEPVDRRKVVGDKVLEVVGQRPDGKPFTAGDVAYSIKLLKQVHPGGCGTFANAFSNQHLSRQLKLLLAVLV